MKLPLTDFVLVIEQAALRSTFDWAALLPSEFSRWEKDRFALIAAVLKGFPLIGVAAVS